MAVKTFRVVRDMKNPIFPKYGTRMLKAGGTIELDGPIALLYKRIGAIGEEVKPPTNKIVGGIDVYNGQPLPKPKAAPRKRAAKKK